MKTPPKFEYRIKVEFSSGNKTVIVLEADSSSVVLMEVLKLFVRFEVPIKSLAIIGCRSLYYPSSSFARAFVDALLKRKQ